MKKWRHKHCGYTHGFERDEGTGVVTWTERCCCGRVRVTRSCGPETPEWRRPTIGELLGGESLPVKRVEVKIKLLELEAA